MKIGIFGGRFDPVHIAHIILLRIIAEVYELERILLIPAYNPPHKTVHASYEHRKNMLELAIKDEENLQLIEIEKKKNISYTFDTLTFLLDIYKHDKLYLIIGEDEWKTFNTWYKYEEIENSIDIIVMPREEKKKLPLIQISSTDIRKRIKNHLSIRYMVPYEVETYIFKHKLYRR